MTVTYRRAAASDVAACIELRGMTRENAVSVERLRQLGVTQASWSAAVENDDLPGYVCLDDGRIVGYIFADKHTGEVVVLALLPDWEGKGIGKKLLGMIVADLTKLGFQRLFLGCSPDPKVRSYGFYRHLGWKSTGTFDANQDEVLELYPVQIRKAQASDGPAILEIILPVIREGATYTLEPDMSDAEALAYWLSPEKATFVAEQNNVIVGTYFIRPNQAGGGKHVCNCGYMTRTAAAGRGVARSMCQHSLAYAREQGFRAMQFNFVVSTNERAVRLWQSLGFEIVGRLPGAFRHPAHGYVDVFVMYQLL